MTSTCVWPLVQAVLTFYTIISHAVSELGWN